MSSPSARAAWDICWTPLTWAVSAVNSPSGRSALHTPSARSTGRPFTCRAATGPERSASTPARRSRRGGRQRCRRTGHGRRRRRGVGHRLPPRGAVRTRPGIGCHAWVDRCRRTPALRIPSPAGGQGLTVVLPTRRPTVPRLSSACLTSNGVVVAEIVRGSSLDWTLVRLPLLHDKPIDTPARAADR